MLMNSRRWESEIHKILIGKSQGKKLLDRGRRGCEHNIKTDARE